VVSTLEQDDVLAPCGELKTLENYPLENFVFNLFPSINLTPEKADDIDTASFEQKQEQIAKMMEEAASDKDRIESLRKELEDAKAFHWSQLVVPVVTGIAICCIVLIVRFILT